jgi:riboflavin biosynthesis pyrimidine reductase
MRRLLPEPAETVDLVEAYAPPAVAPGRAFVRLNMISSLDGAISVNGTSGALGGPADKRVFATLRSWADVIVVGSGTVRAEHYGPARLDDATQRVRLARGQSAQPPIAVVSRSADFDFGGPFFAEATSQPVIVTTEDRADDVAGRAAGAARILGAGTGTVDLAGAIAQLAAKDGPNVLCEGGPGLNSDLARNGVLDELCLTMSPRIVGGDGPRIIAGPPFVPAFEPTLVHLLEEDGFQFLRLALRR